MSSIRKWISLAATAAMVAITPSYARHGADDTPEAEQHGRHHANGDNARQNRRGRDTDTARQNRRGRDAAQSRGQHRRGRGPNR